MQEALLNPASGLHSVEDADFLSGITLADQHNLYPSDAALRAAEAEGLPTLNPETLAAARLVALASAGR